MGLLSTQGTGGGGGGSGGGLDLTTTNNLLNQILGELQLQYDPGMVRTFVDLITITTAGTFQQLYPVTTQGPKVVRRAVIQNLSSTDFVTITATLGSAKGAKGAAGSGIVLNNAAASGGGGGSLTVQNVDLATLWVTSSTNNTQLISVYGETT